MDRLPASLNVVDAPLPLKLDRPFYVNRLEPTHRQLLLRSPMGESYGEKIDILFMGVSAVKLTFELSTLEIRVPTAADYEAIVADCGDGMLARAGIKCYMISGGPSGGYVVAFSVFMTADQDHGANESRLLLDVGRNELPDLITRLI